MKDEERIAKLESRLAEAEKALAEERGVSSTTIAGCIKFEEENRALSARIRELEGAEKLALTVLSWLDLCRTSRSGAEILMALGNVHVEAREFRAARALKGEG